MIIHLMEINSTFVKYLVNKNGDTQRKTEIGKLNGAMVPVFTLVTCARTKALADERAVGPLTPCTIHPPTPEIGAQGPEGFQFNWPVSHWTTALATEK